MPHILRCPDATRHRSLTMINSGWCRSVALVGDWVMVILSLMWSRLMGVCYPGTASCTSLGLQLSVFPLSTFGLDIPHIHGDGTASDMRICVILWLFPYMNHGQYLWLYMVTFGYSYTLWVDGLSPISQILLQNDRSSSIESTDHGSYHV